MRIAAVLVVVTLAAGACTSASAPRHTSRPSPASTNANAIDVCRSSLPGTVVASLATNVGDFRHSRTDTATFAQPWRHVWPGIGDRTFAAWCVTRSSSARYDTFVTTAGRSAVQVSTAYGEPQPLPAAIPPEQDPRLFYRPTP